jgi:hypothetical protein
MHNAGSGGLAWPQRFSRSRDAAPGATTKGALRAVELAAAASVTATSRPFIHRSEP